MKLGILKCDTVRDEFINEFGDYDQMFKQLFLETGAKISFVTYEVHQHKLPASSAECDAFLITGSRWGVYNEESWIPPLMNFIRQLHTDKVPTLGICFGHQIVAHSLGGKAGKSDKGWGVGVVNAQVTNDKEFMQPKLANFSLLVSHQDQVTELPPNAEHLAGNQFCPYAAFVIDDHMLCFQGHPEFTPGYSSDLMDFRKECIGEPTYQQGKSSLSQDTDHKDICTWMVNFIQTAKGNRTDSA